MNFTAKIVDEKVVYQSLHQVYLRLVKLIYFKIFYANSHGNKDKYYCNVIELYNKWAEWFHAKKKEEEEAVKHLKNARNKAGKCDRELLG